MDLTRVLTKGVDDKYAEDYFSTKQLQDWFVKNTDKEGNVTEDIVLFDKAEVKVVDKDRIQMVMSDSTLDRSFERMDQSGWVLKNYKKNPVMLFGHQIAIPAIGIMEKVSVEEEKLVGFPKFDPKEIDEYAWMIGEKVKIGTLRAGSVGFRVLKLEVIENEKDPTRYVIREMELYEFSIVNVPALPSALTNWRKGEDKVEEKTEEIDALRKEVEENTVKELEREKELVDAIELLTNKVKELEGVFEKQQIDIESKTKELEDLKTEVKSSKSDTVNHLFDTKDNKPVSVPEEQQISALKPAQQISEPDGSVSK